MKAAFVVAPRKFEIRDIEVPSINDNEMLVRLEACGVCSSDMSGYTDSYNDEMKKRRPFPRRLGHEPSGTVVEAGRNVKDFKIGDRITGFFADGCYAQYVSCDPSNSTARGHGYMIEKIPEGIPVEYAMGEPLMDLVSIARVVNPELGDCVFQVGCGFMGLGVIAGVASPRIREFIVCDLEDWRLDLARDLGATITLNPNKVDVAKEVMKITGGKGVEISIEVVGHPPGLKMAGSVIKTNRGKMICVGWHQSPDTYDLSDWIRCPVIYSPQGIGMSQDPKSELRRAMWALKKGIYPMEKLVTHKYRLEDINQAFQDNLSRKPGFIKGVIML
jgi:threonine dehydrogenase-like Zn-dependent dehydrogenase